MSKSSREGLACLYELFRAVLKHSPFNNRKQERPMWRFPKSKYEDFIQVVKPLPKLKAILKCKANGYMQCSNYELVGLCLYLEARLSLAERDRSVDLSSTIEEVLAQYINQASDEEVKQLKKAYSAMMKGSGFNLPENMPELAKKAFFALERYDIFDSAKYYIDSELLRRHLGYRGPR